MQKPVHRSAMPMGLCVFGAFLFVSINSSVAMAQTSPQQEEVVQGRPDGELRQSEISVTGRGGVSGYSIGERVEVREGAHGVGSTVFSIPVRHRTTGVLAKPVRTFGAVPGLRYLPAGTPVFKSGSFWRGNIEENELTDLWCAPFFLEAGRIIETDRYNTTLCVPVRPRSTVDLEAQVYVAVSEPFVLSPTFTFPLLIANGIEFREFTDTGANRFSVVQTTIATRIQPRIKSWSVKPMPMELRSDIYAEAVLKRVDQEGIVLEVLYREGNATRPFDSLTFPVKFGEPRAINVLGAFMMVEVTPTRDSIFITNITGEIELPEVQS